MIYETEILETLRSIQKELQFQNQVTRDAAEAATRDLTPDEIREGIRTHGARFLEQNRGRIFTTQANR